MLYCDASLRSTFNGENLPWPHTCRPSVPHFYLCDKLGRLHANAELDVVGVAGVDLRLKVHLCLHFHLLRQLHGRLTPRELRKEGCLVDLGFSLRRGLQGDTSRQ